MNIGRALNRSSNTSKETGDAAEAAVEEVLLARGYQVMHRNWRSRRSEIDIVAQKGSVRSFIEVKYRSSDTAGSGLEYITPAKVAQMKRAATEYCMVESYEGELELVAVEVYGSPLVVGELVPIVD